LRPDAVSRHTRNASDARAAPDRIIARKPDPTLAQPVTGDLQQAQFATLVARMAGGDESALSHQEIAKRARS
jgi:hypothetical protein